MPIHPEFEVSARIPGASESEVEDRNVPDWCELVVDIEQEGTGARHRAHLTRDAGEVLIDVLHEALHPYAGASIRDLIWEQMDEVYARLREDRAEPDDRGRAQGLATALALMTNPLNPSPDVIRSEAGERYDAAQDDWDIED